MHTKGKITRYPQIMRSGATFQFFDVSSVSKHLDTGRSPGLQLGREGVADLAIHDATWATLGLACFVLFEDLVSYFNALVSSRVVSFP